MGIHLIHFKNSQGQFESHYFENYDALVECQYDFPKNTIVYEAEQEWSPKHLEDHIQLQKYNNLHARVGRRGELLFEKMADQNDFVAQPIDQDKDKYQRFITIMGDKVKRSDFIILNLPDVEVDVKCLSLNHYERNPFYRINAQEIEKYKIYCDKTGRKLVFAIFQRKNNQPISKSLAMIELSELINLEHEYYQSTLFVKIPTSKLHIGFNLLESFKIHPNLSSSAIVSLPQNHADNHQSTIEEKKRQAEESGKMQKPQKNKKKLFPLISKAIYSLINKQSIVELCVTLLLFSCMYFVTVSLKNTIAAPYISGVHLAFAYVFFKLLIKSSKKRLALPLAALLAGGSITHYLTQKSFYLSFPQYYYVILLLMGTSGLLLHAHQKIKVRWG